jgi:hypothetical protein
VCDEVEKLRAPSQKADGSDVALTMFLQAGSIGLRRRRALWTKSNVSIHATPTEDGVRMISVDDVMVFIIYH